MRAIGDVENALAAGQNLAERAQLLDQTIADQQRALELAQTSYRVGKIDLRSVQQQQLNVYAARLAGLRVQSEQLSQRANLHLVLGGSFEIASAQSTQVTAKLILAKSPDTHWTIKIAENHHEHKTQSPIRKRN